LTPQPPAEQSVTTPLDDPSLRERVQTGNTTRPSEQASASSSAIPAEVAAQWPIDTVLIWLAKNQFSKEWQQTFSALDISGSQFLEMGVKKGSPKTSQMIHLHVYPRLKEECHASGNTFDQAKEREEVKRMRRLINNILTGKTVEPTKASIGLQGRKESTTSRTGSATLSAGTEPESPSVSLFSSGRHFRWSCINMS
jgi:mitogen-activated protein kinase kinase kinase